MRWRLELWDASWGFFFINLIITYQSKQHKYEVEIFNSNHHIVLQRYFHKNENSFKRQMMLYKGFY